ncbi:MAG: T9SS type A sorting domain-containing protein [Bacteroidetes bacterium]|nr:T9SS type A sorting domain-containing protein [Bacteroidota bacterium]
MVHFLLKYGLIIAVGLSLNAQPPINQWYDFGRTQSAYSNVVVTDSCYYSIGQAASNVVTNSWDMIFTKTAFDGTLVYTHFLHYDTVSINSFYSNLIQTYDDNFVTAIDYDQYFMFIKYSPQGDTIFTSIIKDIYLNDGHVCVYPTSIRENPEDSSYSAVVCLQNEISLETFIGFVDIDKNGSLGNYVLYNINQTGYTYIYPRSLIRVSDGYVIACDILKDVSEYVNDSERVRLIKTDLNGNEQWRWTDMSNANDLFPGGLIQTGDGGYLYGGMSGWFNTTFNAHFYRGRITKLNADKSVDWEIEMGDSSGMDYIRFSAILELPGEEYVATGFNTADSMTQGWLVKFDIDGNLKWESNFAYVPSTTSSDKPWHELNDVEQTPDNGFIMTGFAWDKEATFSGNPGNFAWLVKTDSVGCLVPGCQDFFGIDAPDQPQIKLSLYPNPTSQMLNIYFYDPTFSGNSAIQVFDMQGKLLREWPVSTNDITFMYDVSGLTTGMYVLKVVENGIECCEVKFVKD